MKIGCISWSHRNTFANDGMDFAQWMDHCKNDAKLDGVELWNNHFESIETDYLQTLKVKSDALDLPIYSVATKCIFGDFSDEEIQAAKQVLRDWLNVADYLGAPLLRVSVAGKDLRDPNHQNMVFDALTQVVEEGQYHEISVGIENQEPGVVQNVADVDMMVARSNGLLKVILDNGSFLNKEDSYEFLEKTIQYAGVIHTKFFDIREDGSDKVLDYEKIAKIIKNSNYDSYLSIEYDSIQSAVEDVPVIANYMRILF